MRLTRCLSLLAAGSLTVTAVPAVAQPSDPASPHEEVAPSAVDPRLRLTLEGSYETRQFDESAAEIVSFDPVSQRLFVVNAQKGAIDILSASDPTNPEYLETLTAAGVEAADGSVVPEGAVVNSVKVHGDWIAVATEAPDKTDHGWALFYTTDGAYLGGVRVGSLPDMINVSADGSVVVVANEGEPADDFSSDPEGSVSVIDVADPADLTQDDVRTARFTAYDEGTELPEGVRVFGPDVDVPEGHEAAGRVARNLEPEYVVIDDAGEFGYAALQEANAIATIDLASAEVVDLWAIPLKDWSLPENVADFSDRDGEDGEGAINLRNAPVHGMAMPDGMATYTVDGEQLLVTANEGDAREFGDYVEPVRIKDDDYVLCEDVFGGPEGVAELKLDENLGRQNASIASGLREGEDCYERIDVFGGRGFSILSTDGEVVFDSGGMVEQAIVDLIDAGELPEHAFNANNDETPSFDVRSDDKGPEPEFVSIGQIGPHTFAFLGLERIGGVMAFDVTDPTDVRYVDYLNHRNWDIEVDGEYVEGMGDLGAEGLEFVPAGDSPNGSPLIIAANEVSGSTTIFSAELSSVDRVAGGDRYETAVEVARQFPAGTQETVYLTTGAAYPDALVAASRAGAQDAPVLLTRPDVLSSVTAQELERLAPERVVLVGGSEAISEQVGQEVGEYADEVERVAGDTRYATAAELSADFPSGIDRLYLASGEQYPDALVGGARAATEDAPVLLTRSDLLPAVTAAEVARLDATEIVVLGGPAAVSEDVLEAVGAVSGAEVTRVAGADRYETAALLAADVESPVALSFVASGADYPDALTGAAAAGSRGVPILLTRPTALSSATAGALSDLDPTRLIVLGGTEAVAESVLDSLEQFLP